MTFSLDEKNDKKQINIEFVPPPKVFSGYSQIIVVIHWPHLMSYSNQTQYHNHNFQEIYLLVE